MNVNTFLDVDDTIMTKALTLPENAQDHEDLEKALYPDTKPFFIIQPKPGACVKTKTDSGEKVFLNICTSDKIPAPEDITDAQLLELLSEDEPSFVVPMSIGNERLEADKGGALCATYDIALNTTYFEKCQKKTQFWLFTISVIMDGVSTRFGKTLNTEQYTVLKNKKVMGTLQQHRIENREVRKHPQVRKPLIEELPATFKNSSKENKNKPKSKYTLLRQPAHGTPKRIIALFEVPKNITSKDVAVHVNQDRVVVTIERPDLAHDISLPYLVRTTSAKCFLDKDLGVLRLNLEVKGTEGKNESH